MQRVGGKLGRSHLAQQPRVYDDERGLQNQESIFQSIERARRCLEWRQTWYSGVDAWNLGRVSPAYNGGESVCAPGMNITLVRHPSTTR
jgi:hypothetical protein